MKDPLVSVVIPSYNNALILSKVLLALTEQTLPLDQLEVIVVDDGSTDCTEQTVASLALPRSFRYVRQLNRGAAAARNRGASMASGHILVFLDSDVIPGISLVQEHLKSHCLHKLALVVGPTRSVPSKCADTFYSVLGSQIFSLDEGEDEKLLTFQQMLSRNLSVRRAAFHKIGGFDEDFPRSGFEDVEFAYRATQLAFRMVYNPKAVGDHVHSGTLRDVGQNMYRYQISAALLIKKHPELRGQINHLRDKEPIQWHQDHPELILRKVARQILALPVLMWLMEKAVKALENWYPSPSLLGFMYWKVLGSYLLLGFRTGLKRNGLCL